VEAVSRPRGRVGAAGMDTGLLDKSMAARVEMKPAAANPAMLTKKVAQKAGIGGVMVVLMRQRWALVRRRRRRSLRGQVNGTPHPSSSL
jgi:hypothetical protein